MMMKNRLGLTKTFILSTLCPLISASRRLENLSPSNITHMTTGGGIHMAILFKQSERRSATKTGEYGYIRFRMPFTTF